MVTVGPDQVSPSAQVVEAIAGTAGVPSTELSPLYDAIDPDALDSLVGSAEDGTEIGFAYGEYDVTVTVTGGEPTIEIRKRAPLDQ